MEGPPLHSFDWTMEKNAKDVGCFSAQSCCFFQLQVLRALLQKHEVQQAAKMQGTRGA